MSFVARICFWWLKTMISTSRRCYVKYMDVLCYICGKWIVKKTKELVCEFMNQDCFGVHFEEQDYSWTRYNEDEGNKWKLIISSISLNWVCYIEVRLIWNLLYRGSLSFILLNIRYSYCFREQPLLIEENTFSLNIFIGKQYFFLYINIHNWTLWNSWSIH